jgi:hypothetical protein
MLRRRPRALTFEDLLGNVSELEKDVRSIVKIQNEIPYNQWSTDWSIKLEAGSCDDAIAVVKIDVTVNAKRFDRALVIYKNVGLNTRGDSFTIQWGAVPHPIIPVIHAWLRKIDTCLARTVLPNSAIKEELIQVVYSPVRVGPLIFEGL